MTVLTRPAPTCQPPNPDHTPPRTAPPPGACDCHAHVFGPSDRYPYKDGRRYTPPDSPLADYLGMLDGMGLARGILVQPSVYGTDNSCMLDALDAAPDRLRGVVILDVLATPDAVMADMTRRGARGLRVDVKDPAAVPQGHLRRIADRIAPFGWHIDLLPGRPAKLADLVPALSGLPVPVVVEGMGMMVADQPLSHPGFQALLGLLRNNATIWVKLSHLYKVSVAGAPFADATPYAQALIEAAPDRTVWGTDWPHPNVEGSMPRDGLLVDALTLYASDASVRRKVLSANPAALYGFDQGPSTGKTP